MTLSGKLKLGSGVLTALVAACGAAGVYGIATLADSLTYVTGPAWDAADGVMEASIGVEAQMLAVDKVLQAPDPASAESAQVDLHRASEFAQEALDRAVGSGLFGERELRELTRSMETLERLQGTLLEAHEDWNASSRAFADDMQRFQTVMTLAEDLGDQQVEALEREPDLESSWGSGLRERWEAADGAMEAQIALLERVYHYERVLGDAGVLERDAARSLDRAYERLQTCVDRFVDLAVFQAQIPDPEFGQQTYRQYLRQAVPRHRALLSDALGRHRDLNTARAAYVTEADQLLETLEAMEEVGDSKVEDYTASLSQVTGTAYGVIGVVLGLCLLTGLVVTRKLTRGFTAQVEVLRETLGHLSAGRLDQALQHEADPRARDELEVIRAEASILAETLRAFVYTARDSAQTVEESARNALAASSELSTGYQQQYAAVADTVSTLDEFSSTIVSGRDRAEEVLDQARKTGEVAEEGIAAVGTVTTSMNDIRRQVEKIAKSILALSERSQRIGEIVDTVTGIADQSKLLALNASIEAAKAGEYGRGFAVVASEVRQLADRSQTATGEIRGILKEIQRATSEAVMSTEEGSKTVSRGLEQVRSTGRTIDTLGNTIRDSSTAVHHIAVAMNQQASGVQQINELMRGIQAAVDQGTSRAAAIEDVARLLSTRVEELRAVVGRFQTDAEG